jgi:hypothetical protein
MWMTWTGLWTGQTGLWKKGTGLCTSRTDDLPSQTDERQDQTEVWRRRTDKWQKRGKGRHKQSLAATQKRTTNTLLVALDEIKSDLSLLRQFVSDNFKHDDPIFTQLGLDAEQPHGQTDLLVYAGRAFTNAQTLPAPQAALLTQRKWVTAHFTAALAKVTSAQTLNDEQKKAKSESVAATDKFYNLIDEFDKWFRLFAKAEIRHLAKVPGALVKLGLADGLPAKPHRPTEKNPNRKKPVPPPA